MRSTLLLFFLIGMLANLTGQVAGNQMFENTQRYINLNKNPLANAVISGNNEISLTINALINVQPDAFVAVFNVTQVASSLVEVDNLSSKRINGFKSELKNLGLDTASIYVDMISLAPVYDIEVSKKLFSETYLEKPAGFELQKNIHITYKKSELLDGIITAAVQNEIYDLIKVDYFVNDTKKSYETIRDESIKYIGETVKAIEAIGIELDTVHKIFSENQSATYPASRYSTYTTFSRPSLDAARRRPTINADDKVVSTPKNTILYYNPIPYDNYDIIINPVVNEPVVQLSYSLVVKYFIKDAMPKEIIRYMLLTPDGKIQPIEVK